MTKILISIIPLALIVVIACKKEDSIVQQNIILKDKPLAEIKAHIEGAWQFHHSVGGFTGQATFYYKNSYIDFRTNDSLFWVDDAQERAKTKINWIRAKDVYGDSTYILSFYDVYNFPESWVVEGIEKDSLILRDNGADGFIHYLIKRD
ncbi:hypothetical protein MKJ04_21905 [Pontibacter sp. E15-1]|uniref:hypothetical protein n=1 Tax=Pontibacter sp. E15-1 TaxID=2919918 RepID=UPI001F4F3314|nr:hypothetical protein [Pontibacter sp. E15-1]MCJ8167512.1 hypothetical protein [Pontibacter sp. E15-1]